MKQSDIIRLFCNAYPGIERDISIAQYLFKSNKFEHAGEKFRDAARTLLSKNMTAFAIEYYTYASDLFIKCKNYKKAINTEITIYNLHKLNSNVLEMASSYEKIASFYKHYMKDYKSAGWYYLLSAKHHEENQNYISAYKKARFAAECFEETPNKGKKLASHNLALRMALQAGFFEKSGEHALCLQNLMKKDYSFPYISVCVKGYSSFMKTDRFEESLMFVNEIIHAHYNAKMPQERIIKYLIEAQKLHLQVHKLINDYYNEKLLVELQGNSTRITNYSLELRQHADTIGLSDISNFFYLQQQESKRNSFLKDKKYGQFFSYTLWKITCLYGTSLTRWLVFSLVIIFFFGCSFSNLPCPDFFPNSIKTFLYTIHPQINVASINNFFSPFYYSIVTFTTLGYGDITPANFASQVLSVFEVFIGYIMLGSLLTVFSKKLVR